MVKSLKDKWLYFPIVVLLLYFLYRLIDQSKLLFYFPFDYNNDISSYMAQLFFLKECGFLQFCNYWYNGFTAFQFTPPGWFFFTLPFYYLFGDVKIATYVTMILSFVLAFLIIYFSGRHFGFSKFQRFAFFVFMFATAHSIGSFIRLGRVHELFAWVWFLLFVFLVLYYKDRKFDIYSLFIVISYSLIILSYLSIAVMTSLLFLSLFIIKPKKEKILVISYFFVSLLLTSFWIVPYVKGVFVSSTIPFWTQGEWLWQFTSEQLVTNIAVFILPLILFVLFYFYYKSYNDKKELFFFLPVLILALFYFLRLTPLIPIFKNIFPDPYLTFFLFFSLFFFFSINYSKINITFLRFLPYILLILAISSVLINIFHTPQFKVANDKASLDLKNLLTKFNGSFLLFGDYPTTIYSKAVYSYAPIYNNLSTPFGWYPEVKDQTYLDRFYKLDVENSCDTFSGELKYFNTTHVIGYDNSCNKFNECSFNYLESSGNFCLYSIS